MHIRHYCCREAHHSERLDPGFHLYWPLCKHEVAAISSFQHMDRDAVPTIPLVAMTSFFRSPGNAPIDPNTALPVATLRSLAKKAALEENMLVLKRRSMPRSTAC